MWDNMVAVWLVLLIAFVVGEVATAGLVSIWFCFGALAAMIMAVLSLDVAFQIIVFFVVSIVLLLITKPFVKRFLSSRPVATNADKILGGKGIVVETIDNVKGSGAIKIDGKVWTARCTQDVVIPAGKEVQVVEIRGVRAIVNPVSQQ
ncbi:MAG: NfeD family protein [Eubacteriales bacterium]|jgi:membrane protein implicated in regulation of membrane protease activity